MSHGASYPDAFSLPTIRASAFDPPADLESIRELGPLCRLRYPSGHIGWLVTSYTLARAILKDSRFSVVPQVPRSPVENPEKSAAFLEAEIESDHTFPPLVRGLVHSSRRNRQPLHLALDDPEVFHELRESPPVSAGLSRSDPPSHTTNRSLLARYFTVRRISELRGQVEAIVTEQLDAMEESGSPIDLVESFAQAITSLTICALLGVSPSDRHEFEDKLRLRQDPTLSMRERIAAMRDLREYAQGVVRQKRAHPADDLLSSLLKSGPELTDDELGTIARMMFTTGHHTTANVIAVSVFFLLSEVDTWRALQADPSSVGDAVEELLRYLTIVPLAQAGTALTRTALVDVEIEDQLIKAGESVTVSLPAANRDPDKFADPDTFDLERDARGHLAFGQGIHMCLGQHLARLEMQVALSGLIDRFPSLRLAVPPEDVPMHRGDEGVWGLQALPVSW